MEGEICRLEMATSSTRRLRLASAKLAWSSLHVKLDGDAVGDARDVETRTAAATNDRRYSMV